MSNARLKRVLGLSAGSLLTCLGALGIWINKAHYDNPIVHRFCDVWFCPDEFSPERVFQLQQKSALGDAPGQLREFERALVLNSASAYRWADVGDSEFNVRNVQKAKYAFEHALIAAPQSPVIQLRAANFFFSAGDYVGIFQQMAKILGNPDLSSYYETVFFTYSRLGLPLNVILHRGVPENTTAGAPFLRFWIKLGKEAEAKETWAWLRARGPVDSATAGAYVSFLLGQKENALALQTWQIYAQREMPNYCKTNWAFNGNFEYPFAVSPFDWNLAPATGADASRVRTQSPSGQWALQFVFHALDNLDYRQTYESVVLTPGVWHFSAKVKTQEITTDQGPRFHISDFDHPANLDIWTQPEVGTTEWHSVAATFRVRPSTGVIRIEVIRTPSNHLDNKITGTAWIDEIILAPAK